MTETATFGFPEAAARLGVSLRVLRRAIRAGKVPAPATATATAHLSQDWLDSVEAKLSQDPQALKNVIAQKTPAFAHYPGTSAWRKYKVRVRDYARYLAGRAA